MTFTRRGTVAVVGTALLLVSVLATPMAAAEGGDLQFDVEQNADYTATVTVTANGTAAAGANVTVNATAGNYRGEGDYVTDANGTVELPAPQEDVEVTVTVTHDGANAADTLVLEGSPLGVEVVQHEDFTATVTVTDNGTAAAGANVTVNATAGNYTGEGDYVTDANGTVDLTAPDESVTIDVTATYENLTVTENATLAAPDAGDDTAGAFGQLLSDFVASLGGTDAPTGLVVADFVLANNPGDPPAAAGPPDDHPLRDDGTLSIAVEERDGNATVTVTQNGSAAAGANVTVDAVGSATFEGAGDYSTGPNGTVTFGLPDAPTMTTIAVAFDNDSATERVRLSGTLVGPPGDGGSDAGERGSPGDDSASGTDAAGERGPPDSDRGDGGAAGDRGPSGDDGDTGSEAAGERGPPADARGQ